MNGPEILNKYVGASEENVRNLFKVSLGHAILCLGPSLSGTPHKHICHPSLTVGPVMLAGPEVEKSRPPVW